MRSRALPGEEDRSFGSVAASRQATSCLHTVLAVIISRTPLRISIGGGGTDLPSYYRRRSGWVASAAIDKYVYVAINDTFTDDYSIRYDDHERVGSVDDIEHPIVREAFAQFSVGPAVEMVSMADAPSGTGLGSSGSFTVGLLHALHARRGDAVDAPTLAQEACHLEIERLGHPIGKQDQYIAAFGGVTSFGFEPDESVRVRPVEICDATLADLDEHLLLFYTGRRRSAGAILLDQHNRSIAGDAETLGNLDRTKEIGFAICAALEQGDLDTYGALMLEQWLTKRNRDRDVSYDWVDPYFDVAARAGARGGKLVGAGGGGGFLLLLAEQPDRLRRAFESAGLAELPFRFDREGSKIVDAP